MIVNSGNEQLNASPPNFIQKLRIWANSPFANAQISIRDLPQINKWLVIIEFAIILISITIYCYPLIDFSSNSILPGSEADTFQSLDKILEISIHEFGQFPLWNPYFQMGVPYLADPMNHAFNPLFSIPVLLFGARTGFRLGLFFHFLLGGIGMWWFARINNLNAPARVWMALAFAFAGPPVARFYQGQYLFIAGYCLFPWVIGGIFASYMYKEKKFIAVTILSIGLLFFSGNIYFPYYMLFVALLFGLFNLFYWHENGFFLNPRIIKVFLIIFVLSLGLISVQLFPMFEFRNWIQKPFLEEQFAHNFYQIWLDLTLAKAPRTVASPMLPPEEYYAYIGYLPIFALTALFFAWKQNRQKLILFFGVLSISIIFTIHFDILPWKLLYLNTPFLAQFRYPTRLLNLLVFCIISLAGLSMDALLKTLHNARTNHAPASVPHKIAGFLTVFLFIYGIISIYDMYAANASHIALTHSHTREDQIAGWLREYDPGIYTVGTRDNGFYLSFLENHFPHHQIWYHYHLIYQYEKSITSRFITTEANYMIADEIFEQPENCEKITTIAQTIIYKMNDSLPFAFQIPIKKLVSYDDTSHISRDEVSPIQDVTITINEIRIKALSEKDAMLVLLQTFYPGWKLEVDDTPLKIENASGLLSAPMETGYHEYVFTFRPTGFYGYLSISIISFIIVILILFDFDFYKYFSPIYRRINYFFQFIFKS